ncbi:4Fe-4S cluster-binding domain-containing protein [Streptomyces sp. NBC_00989]|uniref:4Fe-4S cluster-binding domain-containing protein n=1 Tax=Streptomyces sp. NBC_00989 TaxID=2903705 RepID=UPI00386873DE|nr:4Fe-4S cluster-binding domain-containing protein [Streptomyces sp. NBC_00989]
MRIDAGHCTLFDNPKESRERVIKAVRHRGVVVPERGSSFFIHLSELCPVACEHCMYASDLTRKATAKDSLSRPELDAAIDFINASRSEKLNITGGGEPFLKFKTILRLLERVTVPRVEIVTAGYWGKHAGRAERLPGQMDEALRRNPQPPETLLRLSIDRYHIDAPQPVLIPHYGNVARAWQKLRPGLALGFRSIQPDMDIVDADLARELGAKVETVNDWNRRIVLPDGTALPITFNVFRLSGKAAELRDDLLEGTQTIKEYYSPFESGSNRLTLATAVNDAIRGAYAASPGAAVTLNSDGTFWIFAGTAPDRRMMFTGQRFGEAMDYFFQDPITHSLVDDGVWALADIVAGLDPATHAEAVAKNDVASLVEDLLAPDDVRLAVTLLAAQRMVDRDRATVEGDAAMAELLTSGADLTTWCTDAVRGVRL